MLNPTRNCTASEDILSVYKAEEGDDAVAPLTNDNVANGKIDGAEREVTGWMGY